MIPSYTLFGLLSVLVVVILDLVLKTYVLKDLKFLIFIAVMMFAELIVNGYLTSRPVFLYGSDAISGFRIGTIPIEDFFMGFSFITFVVILWVYSKVKFLKIKK